MLGFIAGGLIISAIIGTVPALMFTSNFKGRKKIFIATVIALVIGFGLLKLLLLEVETDDKKWNNGICTECGGKYEFQSSTYKKSADEYYYKCKNCGYVIELHSLRNN